MWRFVRAAWLSLAVSLANASMGNCETSHLERKNWGQYFTANPRLAAFPVQSSASKVDIVVVDLKSGAPTKLRSKGAILIDAHLSRDGERLLLVGYRKDSAQFELMSCRTTNYVCRRLVATTASIGSPVDIDDHTVVYASSPRQPNRSVRNQFPRNDLWILEEGMAPKRLTNFGLYQLRSLSVTSSNIYFSAFGATGPKPVIPKSDPLASSQSDIFRLPFDASKRTIEHPQRQLTPLFVSSGRLTSADVAPDESMAAYLSAGQGAVGYRFDLVARDMHSGGINLVESKGQGFSNPVVVDGAVIAREIMDDRYLIGELKPGGYPFRTLVDITDAAIAATEPTVIRIENENGDSR